MQIAHTVQTDDGSVRLNLGDGSNIVDLIACGANGKEVTVHLGLDEVRYLLCDAGDARIALGSGLAEQLTARTLDGGEVTFVVPAGAAAYTLAVADGGGGATALTVATELTVGSAAHDSLIVGISTMFSQL